MRFLFPFSDICVCFTIQIFNGKFDQFSLLGSYCFFSIRLEVKNVVQVKDERKLFDEMQRRFLSFKKHNYL